LASQHWIDPPAARGALRFLPGVGHDRQPR
jgi:hypothetical protein